MSAFLRLAHQRWISRPSYPDHSFKGQTIIVTGGNVGLGKEACKHFTRLGAEKVILSSRNLSKGEAAKAEIERATGRTGVVEVWELDLCSYASTKAFAARAATLDRIDAAIMNASVAFFNVYRAEDNEQSITVNVVSTVLLMLLLIPTLRKSAERNGIVPILNIVNSATHGDAKLSEREAPNTFDALNDKENKNMIERYPVTKLLQVFAMREIASRVSSERPAIVINAVDPGLCKTELSRSAEGIFKVIFAVLKTLFALPAEEGSRNLVHAASFGPESHGKMFGSGSLRYNRLSPNVLTEDGQRAQKKVWTELVEKLEAIEPGVSSGL